jgi:hypothetical protein
MIDLLQQFSKTQKPRKSTHSLAKQADTADKKLKAKIRNQIFGNQALREQGLQTLVEVTLKMIDEESLVQGISHETSF